MVSHKRRHPLPTIHRWSCFNRVQEVMAMFFNEGTDEVSVRLVPSPHAAIDLGQDGIPIGCSLCNGDTNRDELCPVAGFVYDELLDPALVHRAGRGSP